MQKVRVAQEAQRRYVGSCPAEYSRKHFERSADFASLDAAFATCPNGKCVVPLPNGTVQVTTLASLAEARDISANNVKPGAANTEHGDALKASAKGAKVIASRTAVTTTEILSNIGITHGNDRCSAQAAWPDRPCEASLQTHFNLYDQRPSPH